MQRKPVDVGNGLVAASFGLDGSLLSVSAPHPASGLVELTAAPAFPADRDGDGAAVRKHRARLTDPAYAILRPVGSHGSHTSHRPTWEWAGPDWSADVSAWVPTGRPVVAERVRVRKRRAGVLRLELVGRLDRPAYAEITPGGPVPSAWTTSRFVVRGPVVEITTAEPDPSATAVVTVEVDGAGSAVWSPSSESAAILDVAWTDGGPAELDILVTVMMRTSGATVPIRQAPPDPNATSPGRTLALDRIAAGSTRYIRDCTALAVGVDQCCLLTDHRLLPLSWTRDAYYQAALLLCSSDPAAVDVVRRHLAWLWGPGRDAKGVWRRSHFASGAVKDSAYQADQQLYPLLELADFRRVAGGWPTRPDSGDSDPVRWGRQVRRVWRGLPRDPSGLLPGDENPADDPSTYPYLLSSQLLLAYVASRVAEWESELRVEDLGLRADANRTLAATRAAFACEGPDGPQWSYESDGADGRRLYHDANDVPTALAPLWALCDPADPYWQGTMRFAWSLHNPGFVPGRHGGLGSLHTPGVWPLGDAQEWALATLVGDRRRAARVVARLDLVASDDGMLPETYHSSTGEWIARHWFAWPGALVGLLHHTFHHRIGPWATDLD